jgi:hypothetical protein
VSLEFLNSRRVQAATVGVLLGALLFIIARVWWANYWIIKDGQTGTALVTGFGRHNITRYTYIVHQSVYTGSSFHDRSSPRCNSDTWGTHCPVYFSDSRSWLSRLYRPDSVIQGWPVVLIALLVELRALVTLLNPRSRWAFPFGAVQGEEHD